MLSIADRLFPGRDLESLTEWECRRLVTEVGVVTARVHTVAMIPEVVSRVLVKLDFKVRERVRGVCRMWQDAAEGCRTYREFDYHLMNRKGLFHIARQLKYVPYVEHVQSQEEFDILWSSSRGKFKDDRWVIPVEYVNPENVRRAFRRMRTGHLHEGIVEWALKLNYESLVKIRLRGHYRDAKFLVWAIPRAPFDPRGVVWLRDNVNNFEDLVRRFTNLTTPKRPELRVYLSLYCDNHILRDEEVIARYLDVYGGKLPLPPPTAEEYLEVFTKVMDQ